MFARGVVLLFFVTLQVTAVSSFGLPPPNPNSITSLQGLHRAIHGREAPHFPLKTPTNTNLLAHSFPFKPVTFMTESSSDNGQESTPDGLELDARKQTLMSGPTALGTLLAQGLVLGDVIADVALVAAAAIDMDTVLDFSLESLMVVIEALAEKGSRVGVAELSVTQLVELLEIAFQYRVLFPHSSGISVEVDFEIPESQSIVRNVTVGTQIIWQEGEPVPTADDAIFVVLLTEEYAEIVPQLQLFPNTLADVLGALLTAFGDAAEELFLQILTSLDSQTPFSTSELLLVSEQPLSGIFTEMYYRSTNLGNLVADACAFAARNESEISASERIALIPSATISSNRFHYGLSRAMISSMLPGSHSMVLVKGLAVPHCANHRSVTNGTSEYKALFSSFRTGGNIRL